MDRDIERGSGFVYCVLILLSVLQLLVIAASNFMPDLVKIIAILAAV